LGETPLRCAHTHLPPKCWGEPEHASIRGSRARPSPLLPTDESSSPILGPGHQRKPRPRLEASALSAQGSGAPRRRTTGTALSTTPIGHARGMTQGDKTLPLASGVWGLPSPLVSPSSRTPSPPWKNLEGVPGGGRSKPTKPDGQSVRIEQADTFRASSAP
jgi:hypothetical protein